jgi:uncharacterized membrane protein YhaH (DUF805 family)
MHFICPHCSQALSANDVPVDTIVNCEFCKNDFLTPYTTQPLLGDYPEQAHSTKRQNDVPRGFFRRLTSFRGRINRSQYFYGLLFKIGLMFVVGTINIFSFFVTNTVRNNSIILVIPLCVFLIWVNLSLQARRLHDMGKSGFWLLLYLVPLVNYIFAFVIYILCLASGGNKEANKYGSAPDRIF